MGFFSMKKMKLVYASVCALAIVALLGACKQPAAPTMPDTTMSAVSAMATASKDTITLPKEGQIKDVPIHPIGFWRPPPDW
jgi:hypothetical protein